jgi:hypothetical protein
MAQIAARGQSGTWMAFLAMAFAVVGLTGVFATYALPITMERAALREQALDDAAAAAGAPDPAAALRALAPRLGDSADALLAVPVPTGAALLARVAQERDAARARFAAEEAATALRLRWLVSVATLTGALFGCAVIGAAARPRAV